MRQRVEAPGGTVWPVEGLRALARPRVGESAATRDRPYVTVSYAQTLDGRIATRTGDSRWVSGSESLVFAHCLRAEHDAVLVGIGTVVADDPRLTTRLAPGPDPRRVVVDGRLRLPPEAAVLRDGAARGTVVVATGAATADRVERLRALGATVLLADADGEGQVDLGDALRRLAREGVRSVVIEGGAGMITAALRGRLVDRLAVCIAPKLVGSGVEAVGNLDITTMNDALRLVDVESARIGEDLLVIGRPESAPPPGSRRRPGEPPGLNQSSPATSVECPARG